MARGTGSIGFLRAAHAAIRKPGSRSTSRPARGDDCIPLPEPIYRVILDAVRFLEKGEGVIILSFTQEMTTRSAADLLGVSRQYLVQLLDEDKILFHKAGTHSRIRMKDVVIYRNHRDTWRNERLNGNAKEALVETIT